MIRALLRLFRRPHDFSSSDAAPHWHIGPRTVSSLNHTKESLREAPYDFAQHEGQHLVQRSG